MKDIQKIKEFFSKPLEEDFGQALFNRLKPKDSDLESIVNTLKQDSKISNSPDQASFKEALERYIRFNSDRNSIGQAAVRTLNYLNTGDRYGNGFTRIFDMLVDKNNLSEAKTENSYKVVWTDRDYKKYSKVFKNDPKGAPDNAKKKAEEFKKALEDKDKKSKDGLYRSIDLNEAKEETAIDMAKKQLDALGVKYEMSKTDKVRPFKVIYKPIGQSDKFYDEFEDIVDLFNLKGVVKSSMNEAEEKYSVKPSKKGFSVIKTSTGSEITSFDTEEKAKQHAEKLNKMKFIPKEKFNEAKSEDKVDTITMDIPLFLRMLEYAREDAEQDLDLHDVTEKANKLGKERGILQTDDYEEIVGTTEEIKEGELTEANLSNYGTVTPPKGGSSLVGKYSTIQGKSEYDTVIFDYQEGSNKPYGIVQVEGHGIYDNDLLKRLGLRQTRSWTAGVDVYIHDGNYTPIYVSESDFKALLDLWSGGLGREAKAQTDFYRSRGKTPGTIDETTDYMKRRKAQDDYAVSKKDKPSKSTNPKYSGKTDYMKRREKEIEENVAPNHNGKAAPYGSGYKPLEERISEALDKINEELCPAGKAYIKRRQAAGEKSSAYLSGRGVKVCKGQMSGKAKKK
jgi:hypothetical protein